jgi:hypothetical protein
MNNGSPSPEMQDPRRRNQIITLALLGAALLVVFVLATAVGNLQLLPGEPFAIPRPANMQVFSSGSVESELVVLVFRILLAASIIALPIYIIVSILSKKGRRRLLMNLITIAILFLLLNGARSLNQSAQDETQQGNMQMEMPKLGEIAPARPLPEFTPDPSDTTVLAVTVAISLLVVGLTAAAIWYYLTHREKPSAMQALADEAQQAINAIQAGGPLEETITRCYREMCRVLQKERNIERGNAMTPSEFEQVLTAKGFPQGAVHDLTRLFEDIRYGSKQAGAREEQIAIDSLSAIVAHCAPKRAFA